MVKAVFSSTLNSYAYYNVINTGEGNNYINNGKIERSTIISGSGNDTVVFNSDTSSNVVIITDGNNLVRNIGNNSIIKRLVQFIPQ